MPVTAVAPATEPAFDAAYPTCVIEVEDHGRDPVVATIMLVQAVGRESQRYPSGVAISRLWMVEVAGQEEVDAVLLQRRRRPESRHMIEPRGSK